MKCNIKDPTPSKASTPDKGPPRKGDIKPNINARKYLAIGAGVIVFLVAGLVTWSKTEISGAVIASGQVVVDSNVKKIQHPTGGVVSEIRVRDGDAVSAGNLLLKLDDTATRSNVQILTKQLDEVLVRQARLKAELDNSSSIQFPATLQARFNDPQVFEIANSEVALFEDRRKARYGQGSQLRERIAQLQQEAFGLEAQRQAKVKELNFAKEELAGLETLDVQHLVSTTKLMSARRNVAQLEGDIAQLISSAAQAGGKIAEIEIQISQLDRDLKTEAGKDLREQQGKEAELREKIVAAEDILKRVEIRAPQSGRVHQLSIHSIGGVVAPGEILMTIVPTADQLVIEANISAQDIDQVQMGHGAEIKFTAFNQRTTPSFRGVVTRISADVMKEDNLRPSRTTAQAFPAGTANYYSVRLEVDKDEEKGLSKLKLVPGMPAEVMIKTIDRTVLSYLAKPLTDQFSRAFRER